MLVGYKNGPCFFHENSPSLTFFFPLHCQQYSSFPMWLCTCIHTSSSLSLPICCSVCNRERLEHLTPLVFQEIAIKCVYRMRINQHIAFFWRKCHKPWDDGFIWQRSQESLVGREILSTSWSSEPTNMLLASA